ncbi:hypothetical protein [Pedobacter frigiditerrae]|uniref:hypothetical protein n=1 Tax=Pedobacter frigiditerrae TaxID=2530452 RepID=UPI00292D5CC1|nr:hypothetical protein [Pedobacter frigiditerrae]
MKGPLIRKVILIALTIFIFGCGIKSEVSATNPIADNNKDVLVLANLIQEQLIKTKGRAINHHELIQNDTLKRISNNFEKIELAHHGGYISVYYKFSNLRDRNIELTNIEKKTLTKRTVIMKDLGRQFDGEIQLEYGEKFYHIKKIIVCKE